MNPTTGQLSLKLKDATRTLKSAFLSTGREVCLLTHENLNNALYASCDHAEREHLVILLQLSW